MLQIGLLLLALSILVTIHELGHYWAARMFGIRIEVFSLFFGPKLLSFKRGDTEWRISAIPLGGYVKIAGMIDESMDKEQMALPPKPDEFRSKPKWQQLIVMLGGIFMNIVLGIIIFVGMKWIYGDHFIANDKLQYGIAVEEGSLAWKMGFRSGDKLETFMGDTVKNFDRYMANPNWMVYSDKYFTILRDGKQVRIDLPDSLMNTYITQKEQEPFFGIQWTTQILNVDSTFKEPKGKDTLIHPTPAWLAGLRGGDSVVAVDSTPVRWKSEITAYYRKHKSMPVQVAYYRDTVLDTVTVNIDSNGMMMAEFVPVEELEDSISYSFGQSLVEGPKLGWRVVVDQIHSLRMLVTGKLNPGKSMGGIVKISSVMKDGFQSQGWMAFWRLTGLLSFVLAIMNLLPIPGLDGGHVVFLTIEAIIGRDLPLKFKEWAITLGIIFVLGLIAFTIINDIYQMF